MSNIIEDEFPFCLEIVCGTVVPRCGEVCKDFIFVPSARDIVARIGVLMYILMYLCPIPGKMWMWCTRKVPFEDDNIPDCLCSWLESLKYFRRVSKRENDYCSPCSVIFYNPEGNNCSLCIYRFENETGDEVYNFNLTTLEAKIFLELVEDELCSCTGVFVPND